jgi:hypothetical protein
MKYSREEKNALKEFLIDCAKELAFIFIVFYGLMFLIYLVFK